MKIQNYLSQRKRIERLVKHYMAHPDKLGIRDAIEKDLQFLFGNDPSVRVPEHVNCYTSAFAVIAHRIAHSIADDKTARQIAEYAKSLTGVDIHPRAAIGIPFAIDHGVGTVIGETSVIGKNCLLYHGVTLGAKHLKDREQVGQDRHPKLGDNVIIYSNTTILGNIKIPNNMIVGANKFIKNQADIDALSQIL